jgi:hypothetical protein
MILHDRQIIGDVEMYFGQGEALQGIIVDEPDPVADISVQRTGGFSSPSIRPLHRGRPVIKAGYAPRFVANALIRVNPPAAKRDGADIRFNSGRSAASGSAIIS